MGLDSYGCGWGPLASRYKHDNEATCFIKDGDVRKQLRVRLLLKKSVLSVVIWLVSEFASVTDRFLQESV